MIIRGVSLCLLLAVILTPAAFAQRQRASWSRSEREVLVWNQRSDSPLFVTSRWPAQTYEGLGLIYRDREFSVSLLQPLSFSSAGGYFVWWVSLNNQMGERMICFRRESDKQFRAAGIVADLQDLGELKQIKTGSGSTFLFATAGDGQLKLVSARTARAEQLFIDYTADGRVELIRDDFAREATPQYDAGQPRRLVQSWFEHGNKYLTMAVLK